MIDTRTHEKALLETRNKLIILSTRIRDRMPFLRYHERRNFLFQALYREYNLIINKLITPRRSQSLKYQPGLYHRGVQKVHSVRYLPGPGFAVERRSCDFASLVRQSVW